MKIKDVGQPVSLAGVMVDNLTLAEATERVERFIISGQPHLITTPNPEIIVACQQDQELRKIINNSDLRVADGISMVVVSRLIGTPLKERVSGIDLMIEMVKKASTNGYSIFLLGSAPGVAAKAAAKLKTLYPELKIVGTHHGYFSGDDSEVVKSIKAAAPQLLFVGLGAGRQERWLNHHLTGLGVPAAMVIGGSLDVISGTKKRAPLWAQRLYIEWLYRLLTEPKRWRRQLALPKFLYLTLIKRVL